MICQKVRQNFLQTKILINNRRNEMNMYVIITWNTSTPPRLVDGIFSYESYAEEKIQMQIASGQLDDFYKIVNLHDDE